MNNEICVINSIVLNDYVNFSFEVNKKARSRTKDGKQTSPFFLSA